MAFIKICQEGSIMRTLIGAIHLSGEHNKQLCFHIGLRAQSTATVHRCFFFTCTSLKAELELRRCCCCSVTRAPAKQGPLFFGCMPTRNLLPEELCHVPVQFSLQTGNTGNNPFHLIALWQELEWLSRQLYNRFAVKTEILCISPPIY